MNVTLTIPADAGTDRAGTPGRRATDTAEGEDFGALFAKVGEKTDADRGRQAEAPDEDEIADADAAPRGPSDRRKGDAIIWDTAPIEDPGDGPPAEPDKAASRKARRDDETAKADRNGGRKLRPDDGEAIENGDAASGPMAVAGAAGVAVSQMPSDGDAAEPADDGAAAVGKGRNPEPAAAAHDDDGSARHAARPDTARLAEDASGAAKDARAADGDGRPTGHAKENADVSATQGKPPAAGDGAADADAATVRLSARGDTAAALAAASAGDQPTPTDKSRGERQESPGRRGSRPIDARVVSYERHLEPAGTADSGATAATVPPDGSPGGDSETPRGREQRRGWQPLTGTAQSGASSAAKAPADRPVVAPAGQPANPDAAAPPLAAGVAAGIAQALDGARAASTAAAAPVGLDTMAMPLAPEPVRMLALSLDMPEYGAVDLRVSLKGNAVSIQLKAERAETADALSRDDATLRAVLHRAGYDAQQIQIDRRDAAATRPGDGSAASGQQPAAGGGTGASSGHAAGGESPATSDQRPQGWRDSDGFAPFDQDTQDAPRPDRYRGSDRLYV